MHTELLPAGGAYAALYAAQFAAPVADVQKPAQPRRINRCPLFRLR